MTNNNSNHWLHYVSDPKYYRPLDWNNLYERENFCSTDFRKLLNSFRKKLLRFEDKHYGDNDKTGIAMSTPACESETVNVLCGRINRVLEEDYERRLESMPYGRFLKWRNQSENNL